MNAEINEKTIDEAMGRISRANNIIIGGISKTDGSLNKRIKEDEIVVTNLSPVVEMGPDMIQCLLTL